MYLKSIPAVVLLAVAIVGPVAAARGEGRRREVEPGEDYRRAVNRLQPGDELVFLPGVHERAVILDLAGEPDRPITLRGRLDDQGRPPIVQFTGRGHNLWRLRGRHIVIRDLELHATNAYAIRVDRADHVRIENCTFRDCGGGDLSANTADVHALHVFGCTFTGSRSTPVYIGNHDGNLAVTDFRFEGNVIDGRQVESGIGYGIQLKLNVTGGVIRNNWITHTRGPGIMVYGAADDDPALGNLVEGNVVVGARNNPGIVVGGGPARVRENLVLGNLAGGISVMDYGGRDLLRNIEVRGNTAAGNERFDLSFTGRLQKLDAEANVARSRPGAAGIRGPGDVAASNRDQAAPAALLVRIDRLLEAPVDMQRYSAAAADLPEGPLGADALADWLDELLLP